MAGGTGKVKVRKVSFAINSPVRRKGSNTNNTNNLQSRGLSSLPPFKWSSGDQGGQNKHLTSTTPDNNRDDRILMPPPIITRGLKSCGIRKLVDQYAQVRKNFQNIIKANYRHLTICFKYTYLYRLTLYSYHKPTVHN